MKRVAHTTRRRHSTFGACQGKNSFVNFCLAAVVAAVARDTE